MLQPGFFIDNLGLKPHVEGGYYKELYKNSRCLGERPIASAIYYLLKSGQVSRFHRLKSDELWLYHYGSPLRIVVHSQFGKTCLAHHAGRGGIFLMAVGHHP